MDRRGPVGDAPQGTTISIATWRWVVRLMAARSPKRRSISPQACRSAHRPIRSRATGQVWNLPPFSPVALARTGYEPMRAILAANMRHAAALRIDHILGFARQFWVPRGAEGRFGAYVKFPLDALIAVTAIESQRHRCLMVGEDLGTIPDGLRDALAAANIFSYRVLWFEREGQRLQAAGRLSSACACLPCLA